MEAQKERLNDTRYRINDEMRRQGSNFVNSGKDFAVTELENFRDAIHDASQNLHLKNDYMTQLTDNLEVGLDRASKFLKEHDADELVSSINDFAHRHPGLTIGGLAAAGFAVSRYLKLGSHD